MLLLLFCTITLLAQSQTMTWTTKSEKAKELALKAGTYMKNFETAQAYDLFSQALQLDPDFTVALYFMANLSFGETKKYYSDKALKSSANKTEGEKLFVSTLKAENTPESNRQTWEKLHNMFPEGTIINLYYVLTRATTAEQFKAGEEYLKKFPEEPTIYNMMGYMHIQDKKDTVAAKAFFEKYIKLYPEGCNPYDSMGEYYFIIGDMANSEKYYKMALEKYPFNSSSIDKLKEIKASKDKAKAN